MQDLLKQLENEVVKDKRKNIEKKTVNIQTNVNPNIKEKNKKQEDIEAMLAAL